MGSGHFLVTAVDFLADYIADLVEYVPAVPEWLDGDDAYESPLVERVAAIRHDILQRAREANWVLDEAQLSDQTIIRRMVLKRCIYGVDKNPLTVELAKVSLWLHSFTVGAPLSFLDHHLRCGDSLLGLRVLEATGELNRLGGLFASSAIAGAEAATAGMQRIEATVGRRRGRGAAIGGVVPGRRGDHGRPARPARLPLRSALADRRHAAAAAQRLRGAAGRGSGPAAG